MTPCTVPAAGKPTFVLGPDEMEVGVGIHGEPGRRRSKFSSADAIAEEMLGAILGDLAPPAGSECLLLVNGFGGTPLMELYLMVNAARRILAGRGMAVARHLTGSLVTSLDMAGCSMTITLLDERLIAAVGRSGQDGRPVLVALAAQLNRIEGTRHSLPFVGPRTAFWWAGQDSNLQPDRYERPALTIELPARRGAPRHKAQFFRGRNAATDGAGLKLACGPGDQPSPSASSGGSTTIRPALKSIAGTTSW